MNEVKITVEHNPPPSSDGTVQEEKKTGDARLATRQAVHEARQGLMMTLKANFSSQPIDFRNTHQTSGESSAASDDPDSQFSGQSIRSNSVLTDSERKYLQSVLAADDPAALQAAHAKLKDPTLFPQESGGADKEEQQEEAEENAPKQVRRDSLVQQQLFRLHETAVVQPSAVLQRMSLLTNPRANSILADPSDPLLAVTAAATADAAALQSSSATKSGSWDMHKEDEVEDDEGQDFGALDNWDPFKDISSWLDGNQGVEVNDEGTPVPQHKSMNATISSARHKSLRPFRILGTAADDVSCHPHVMSPPLMESLMHFMPESLTDQHYWLKYSLVRDGPGLLTLLRHVRASSNTLLAIETTDGHVLGSFTMDAWRQSAGWYGSKESFLWRMRRSRLEPCQSIVQKACQEGEIQVFPYRVGNVAVQYCDKVKLVLGQGELLPATVPGKHYGHGLYLDANLKTGSTSTSETFGNPCLVDVGQRGMKFEVANVEVWTLTPHATVDDAEQSELSTLFLESGRNLSEKKLDLLGIMVGRPI